MIVPFLLSNVKVLDLSRVLAGPLCTMMLADLGADVIKVERPGTGDETRGWGPPFDSRGESAYFLSVNRNKLSVAADFRRPEDRELIEVLIAGADVIVDNFLPGVLERLGLDPEARLRANPRLVWCSITGFGNESMRPGYDFVVQAESGWMAITGEPDGEPMKAGVALADVVAGKDAAIAILAALLGRDRGGDRRIVISLLGSARAALVNVAQNVLVSGAEARRWGNAHANLVPYQLFHASDRAIVIAVGSDAQWQACARVLGLEELADDVALATNAGRVHQRERVVAALRERVGRASAREVLAALDGAGVPAGVVRTVPEVLRDVSAASPLTGLPPAAGGGVRRPPPRLDEHGSVVRSSGWDAFRDR
jgi:crotonobetainyl-CoA:carnitine CoA-transferase CaiB-like acyl-CoA transferase